MLGRKVAFRILKGPLAAALRGWISRHQQQLRLRNVASRVLVRMLRMAQAAALEGWAANTRECARLRHLLLRVARSLMNRLVATALASWRDRAGEQSLLSRAGQRVVARLANATLARGLTGWQARVRLLRDLRRVALKAALLLSGSLLCRAFAKWQETSAKQARLENILGRAAARMQNLALATATDTWRSAVEAEKHRQRTSHIVLSRWTHRQLAAALDTWVEQHAVKMAEAVHAQSDELRSEIDALLAEREARSAALAAAGLGNPAVLAGLLEALRGQDTLQPVIITQLLRRAAARPRGFLHALSGLADSMTAQPPFVTPADLCSLLEAARAAPAQDRPTAATLVDIVREACAPPLPLTPEQLRAYHRLIGQRDPPVDLGRLASIIDGCPSMNDLELLAGPDPARAQARIRARVAELEGVVERLKQHNDLLPPRVRWKSAASADGSAGGTVSLESQVPGGAVYYSTDLSEPGPPPRPPVGKGAGAAKSAAAVVSLPVVRNVTLRAVCISGIARSQAVTFEAIVPGCAEEAPELTVPPRPSLAAAPPPLAMRSALGGVGMLISRCESGGHVVVKTLTEGGAAASAGGRVAVGDVLVSVDGRDIRGLGTDAIARLITGPAGSSVELTLLRAGGGASEVGPACVLGPHPEPASGDGVCQVTLARSLAGFVSGRPRASPAPAPGAPARAPAASAAATAGVPRLGSEGVVLPDPAALAAAAAAGSLDELGRFRDWLLQSGWPAAGLGGWDDDEEMIV